MCHVCVSASVLLCVQSGFLWKIPRELMDKTGSFKSSALSLPAIHTKIKRFGEHGDNGEVVGTERQIQQCQCHLTS